MSPLPSTINMHATCIKLEMGALVTGVLLTGPSGSGKSSLALQLVDQPGYGASGDTLIHGRLVADDQVLLRVEKDRIVVKAPSRLQGLIEVAGIGIVTTTNIDEVCLGFAVEHCASSCADRMPEAKWFEHSGLKVPKYNLDFRTPVATAMIRTLALAHWGVISLIDGCIND